MIVIGWIAAYLIPGVFTVAMLREGLRKRKYYMNLDQHIGSLILWPFFYIVAVGWYVIVKPFMGFAVALEIYCRIILDGNKR